MAVTKEVQEKLTNFGFFDSPDHKEVWDSGMTASFILLHSCTGRHPREKNGRGIVNVELIIDPVNPGGSRLATSEGMKL